MDAKGFKILFAQQAAKLSEAWHRLSDAELQSCRGDLKQFLAIVQQVYKVPPEVVLRELDAVQQNIDLGIEADYAPRLDPTE